MIFRYLVGLFVFFILWWKVLLILIVVDVLGKVYGVIVRCWGRIVLEEMKEGILFFIIWVMLLVVESFGFVDGEFSFYCFIYNFLIKYDFDRNLNVNFWCCFFLIYFFWLWNFWFWFFLGFYYLGGVGRFWREGW